MANVKTRGNEKQFMTDEERIIMSKALDILDKHDGVWLADQIAEFLVEIGYDV